MFYHWITYKMFCVLFYLVLVMGGGGGGAKKGPDPQNSCRTITH